MTSQDYDLMRSAMVSAEAETRKRIDPALHPFLHAYIDGYLDRHEAADTPATVQHTPADDAATAFSEAANAGALKDASKIDAAMAGTIATMAGKDVTVVIAAIQAAYPASVVGDLGEAVAGSVTPWLLLGAVAVLAALAVRSARK